MGLPRSSHVIIILRPESGVFALSRLSLIVAMLLFTSHFLVVIVLPDVLRDRLLL